MTNTIWRTGHHIADTVANSLAKGMPINVIHHTGSNIVSRDDVHFCYGILRGADDVFRAADKWFNIDRGFWGANHFDGTYRISFRGTQPVYDATLRTGSRTFALKPWRTNGSYILICPPTKPVCDFFGVDPVKWLQEAKAKCELPYVVRYKDDPHALDFTAVQRIITFNSSVGWLALAEGIEVDSDPTYSTVGSYCYKKSIDNIDRTELFNFMWSCQFTLAQIEQGKAWPIINHYIQKSRLSGCSHFPQQ